MGLHFGYASLVDVESPLPSHGGIGNRPID